MSDPKELPMREGPRPASSPFPPHIELDAEPVPALVAALAEWCFGLPDVEEQPTQMFLAESRALCVVPDATHVRADTLMAGREFAHIHPNGDMHIVLPPDRAQQAITAGWAEALPPDPPDQAALGRPSAASTPAGMVLIYTPRTREEVAVLCGLVRESRDWVLSDPSE